MPGEVVIGTSSWADVGFTEEWYPQGLPARERLPYYAKYFQAVEVNSTFYSIPSMPMVARWAQVTPAKFSFDVKLHKVLSRHTAYMPSIPFHLRHKARSDSSGRIEITDGLENAILQEILRALAPLEHAGKLSSLLLQLSPSFSPERHSLRELDGIVAAVAPRKLAVEFRHRGWVQGKQTERTLSYLSEHRLAFVCVDAPAGEHFTIMPSDISAVTRNDLAYLRAHGRNTEGYLNGRTVAERFAYRYSDEELQQIITRAQRLAGQLGGGQTRVMLNNNRGRDAPDAAERMLQLLRGL